MHARTGICECNCLHVLRVVLTSTGLAKEQSEVVTADFFGSNHQASLALFAKHVNLVQVTLYDSFHHKAYNTLSLSS